MKKLFLTKFRVGRYCSTLILWHIFILLLSGCLKKSQENDLTGHEDVIDIDLGEKQQFVYASEFVDSINITPLETNNDHLIGHIDKLICHDNRLFILDRSLAQSLFCFDLNGNIIFKINNVGKGPGEYSALKDFSIDKDNNRIVLYDLHQQKYLYYTLDGVFVKEVKVNLYFTKFAINGEYHYIF